jgi:hypothetical protein
VVTLPIQFQLRKRAKLRRIKFVSRLEVFEIKLKITPRCRTTEATLRKRYRLQILTRSPRRECCWWCSWILVKRCKSSRAGARASLKSTPKALYIDATALSSCSSRAWAWYFFCSAGEEFLQNPAHMSRNWVSIGILPEELIPSVSEDPDLDIENSQNESDDLFVLHSSGSI